jgi:hypothetical protein
MPNAAVIVNHIHFPYRLFEQSLWWAKNNQADIKIVFLTPNTPQSGGGTSEIILNQIKAVEEQSAAHHLFIDSIVLFQPSLNDVLKQVADSEKIFIEIQDEESLKVMMELGRNRQMVSNRAFGDA